MERKYQLDFFRGFFLVIITIDHFLKDNDVIKRFTYEFIGWVTAAEGFVFLSGLTAGLVYTYKFNQKGYNFISAAAKNRSWLIYRNHIITFFLAFLFILFIPQFTQYWQKEFSYLIDYPFITSILSIFLIYKPNVFDILPMYAVFLLFVPLVIYYLSKGYYWQIALFSLLLYIVGSIGTYSHFFEKIVNNEDINTGYFNILSWQLLFMAGIFVGFFHYLGKTKNIQINRYIFYVAILITALSFIVKNTHLDLKYNFDISINKHTLGPLRLINFFALFFIFTYLSTKKGTWFKGKALCYLGQYSLEVFSAHIVLMILFRPIEEYFDNQLSIKVVEHFYIYPTGGLMLLLIILPLLYLAPTILKRRIVVASKS